MGFMDKLKDAGKKMGDAAIGIKNKLEENARENANAVYLDDFEKHGSIKGDSLPKTENSLYFRIDAENEELIIVEAIRATGVSNYKNKLVQKISLNDICKFKALSKEREKYTDFDALDYVSEILCTSGEKYTLYNVWFNRLIDKHIRDIIDEMDGNSGLNAVLLNFVTLVSDDFTKQWYNEIYEERGEGPIFSENGEIDLDNYMQMHSMWFERQNAEWQERIKNIKNN